MSLTRGRGWGGLGVCTSCSSNRLLRNPIPFLVYYSPLHSPQKIFHDVSIFFSFSHVPSALIGMPLSATCCLTSLLRALPGLSLPHYFRRIFTIISLQPILRISTTRRISFFDRFGQAPYSKNNHRRLTASQAPLLSCGIHILFLVNLWPLYCQNSIFFFEKLHNVHFTLLFSVSLAMS